jgi:hypothetical protein
MKRVVGLVLGLLLALLPATWAQQSTGNVFGTVVDESGAVMPGAGVSLTGPTIGKLSTVTGSQGDFHFLNLDPSTYKLEVSLAGFSTVLRQVIVNSGQNVNLSFSLKVATQAEVVTVTAETPVVDTKKVGTSTTLTKEELSDIPNSRDPWALLRTIPGVVVDRVNVAGNESGQQSSFQGKGSAVNDSMWSLDGVTITDAAAIGSSPAYYDYDAFDEVNITTGGTDIKVATGGIGLNFVTKRGTNNFHGNIHTYFTDHKLQTTNLSGSGVSATDPRLALPNGGFSTKANNIDQIADYGGDLGGPIIKDKLWFWGSFGKQDIRNVNFNQTKDKTLLKDYSGKLNWQASPSDMISAFYFLGQKNKFGRDPGLAGNEPASFHWNQGGAYAGGPHGLLKGEWNHIFSSSFTLNAKYAYSNIGGFGLFPEGGLGQAGGWNQTTDTTLGSYVQFSSLRPQHIVNLDGNYFFAGMGGNNELKFGFGYRRAPVTSTTTFGGDMDFGVVQGADAAGNPTGVAWITRPRNAGYLVQYSSGYLGDTFSKGRLTINAGVRYDHQTGANSPSSAVANPAFPTILPALNFPGGGQGIKWNNVSPRVALTYALDEARKTVLRASYARYAGQLAGGDAAFDNPLGSNSLIAYQWTDLNHDGLAQPNEINFGAGVQYAAFVDPNNPGQATASVNKIDPNYKANTDDEVIVGLDREVIPDFAVSAAYTWRRETNTTQWYPRIGLTTANYTAGPVTTVTANGTTYSGQAFSPDPALVAATGGGVIITNRPDYHTSYSGIELSLIKRLSHRWMSRVAFSYMDWKEYYDGPNAVQNPMVTDTGFPQGNNPWSLSGPQQNGGQYAPRSAGSGKGDIFYSPKWQISASGLYQLPADFELSASLFAGQGYPEPIILRLNSGGDGTNRVLVSGSAIDSTRYPNKTDLDLRLAKNIHFGGSGNMSIIADCFNVFNSNTVLNVTRQANSSAFGRINELLSPRVFRFGVRLGF